MEDGWIKIHRKIRQWQHYKRPYTRMVFEELLLSANWHDGITEDGIKVSAGDAVVSLKTIQENTGLSKPTIIKEMNRLVESGEITKTRIDNATVVHINNFCFYQLQDAEDAVNGIDQGGKRDLPLTDLGSKRDLPQQGQVVNEIYQGGKRRLPIQEDKNIYILSHSKSAPARTHESELAEKMINEQPWFEQLCMSRRIDAQTMRELIIDFCAYLRDIGKEETLMDAKIHFVNQLHKQIKILKDGQQSQYIADPVARRNYERNQRIQSVAARAATLATERGQTEEKPY